MNYKFNIINYSNPPQDVLGHDESPAPRPLVSNLIVPANAPESLPSTSHLDITDLSTITSLSSLSDEQRYQILTNTGTKLKEYSINSQKWHFQSLSCFHGNGIPYQSMVCSVSHAFCLAKLA